MTDQLRDRIAAALGGEQYINLLGNGYDQGDLLALADAVIAELQFTKVQCCGSTLYRL